MSENPTPKWRNPDEILKLLRLKKKKQALQARINNTNTKSANVEFSKPVVASSKRKNPFASSNESNKRSKTCSDIDESSDETLFKLLNINRNDVKQQPTAVDFRNILQKQEKEEKEESVVENLKGTKWIPIDWSLKNRLRLLYNKPPPWNQHLKMNERSAGLTSFIRCVQQSPQESTPNSQFHQCCLYWQHPHLSWINLYPRIKPLKQQQSVITKEIKESLQSDWMVSFQSLFNLIRTKQCPYFYLCANTFTVVFRASGLCGFSDMHALVTPTTRGFRRLLEKEEIEYTMPLKVKQDTENGENCNDDDGGDDDDDNQWMEDMGLSSNDIKQINYTQNKINVKSESSVDNSDESTILIEGPEVQAFFSFLLNYKGNIAATGCFAGIPPTLLSPVGFRGANLKALDVREHTMNADGDTYYALDLLGPILPHTIHSLYAIQAKEHAKMTATFTGCTAESFSRVRTHSSCDTVFAVVNLSDCGMQKEVLKHFCSHDDVIRNVECLKYSPEDDTYLWN